MNNINPHDCTFVVPIGCKRTHLAGKYDQDSQKPFYEIEILIPPEWERHRVDISQYLYNKPDGVYWGWEVINNSTYPAHLNVKKDGVIL